MPVLRLSQCKGTKTGIPLPILTRPQFDVDYPRLPELDRPDIVFGIVFILFEPVIGCFND